MQQQKKPIKLSLFYFWYKSFSSCFSKSAYCDIPQGMKSTGKETYHFSKLMEGKIK